MGLNPGLIDNNTIADVQDGEGNSIMDPAKNAARVTQVESLPTEGFNPSSVLGFTDGKITSITLAIEGNEYRQTFSYTGDNLTGISSWVQI